MTVVQRGISIHAAREGGDHHRAYRRSGDGISIHAAREGGDYLSPTEARKRRVFQSTPPVKAATLLFGLCMHERFISIHAAREGGDAGAPLSPSAASISIHAAREGGDISACLL